MINITKLRKSDRGRWVKYVPMNDYGKIKSWNETWIFVVYNCNNNWKYYSDYTAVATNADDLVFVSRREVKRAKVIP